MGKNLPGSPSSKPRFSLAAGNSQASLFPALQISGAALAVDMSNWGVEAPSPPRPRGPRGPLGARSWERRGEGGSSAAARKS